jgi:hypothetical protein
LSKPHLRREVSLPFSAASGARALTTKRCRADRKPNAAYL